MTEFRRASTALETVERLIAELVSIGVSPPTNEGQAKCCEVYKELAELDPLADKMRRRCQGDQATYGPKMVEKVTDLLARFDTVRARFTAEIAPNFPDARAAVPAPTAAPAGAAPAQNLNFQRVQPLDASLPRSTGVTPSSRAVSSMGSTLGGGSTPDGASRREIAARAAEARFRGSAAPAPSPTSPAVQQLCDMGFSRADVERCLKAANQNPERAVEYLTSGIPAGAAAAAGEEETAVPSEPGANRPARSSTSNSLATSVAAAVKSQPQTGPLVARMDALMHLVHCVFLNHGYVRIEEDHGGGSAPATATAGPGPFRVRYRHDSGAAPIIAASYVPVQRHLVIYAGVEARGDGDAAGSATGAASEPFGRVSVQLGMPVESVQAKVDYLLVYPLTHRQCVPALAFIPSEVCFGLLCGLALPALSALGCASRNLSNAVFQDDVLWWKVLLALPPSDALSASVEAAMGGERTAQPGTWRCLVREEVARARVAAEEQKRRMEEMEARRREMRDPLLVQPSRRPGRGPFFPGGSGFPGGPGGFNDIMPGGGLFPPGGFGGGRRDPFGGGGGFGIM